MITVENEIEVNEPVSLTEVEVGEAFVGTIEDLNGEEQTGVFVRTSTGVVLLDDPGIEFESFSAGDDSYYVPKCQNFKLVDITVRVEQVYE